MPLSKDLLHTYLTYHCPRCGHPVVKSGAWFWSARRVVCQGTCNRKLRLTYADKVALFEEHAARHPPT